MLSQPLRWDSGRRWDTPGLRWDSTVPSPPKPKPARRSPRRHPINPNPNQPMPTFKYNVAPKAAGGFTTRAVRGTAASQAVLLAAIAAETGVTAQQAENVIKAFFQKVLACAAGCDWSPEMFGLINFRPTSGGSSPAPDGFHSADDINADVSISFTAETIRQWRATLALESMGEVGKVTPVVDAVIRQSDGQPDKYTAGGLIQVRGDHMDFDRTDVTQGVFFKPGAGAEVRATEYGAVEPQSVIVLVPAALSGALTVRVATYINGSVRSYTYTNPLTTP